MRAVVDEDACVGCGLCVDACPGVFEMDGDIAKVIVDEVPENDADACSEAAEACPVEAIKVED